MAQKIKIELLLSAHSVFSCELNSTSIVMIRASIAELWSFPFRQAHTCTYKINIMTILVNILKCKINLCYLVPFPRAGHIIITSYV